jgi:hypothetical protein
LGPGDRSAGEPVVPITLTFRLPAEVRDSSIALI